MEHPPRRIVSATVVFGLAGLHLAWAGGSSIPFRDRRTLADRVVGRPTVPGAGACVAVAAALVVAGALVLDVPVAPARMRRLGRTGVTGVLATRGVLGLTGLTERVSPGSSSPNFVRLDRRLYAPLCLALAAGSI